MEFALHFRRDESGQDLLEYSLLVTFIAIACMALIASSRPAANAIWISANSQLVAANSAAGG